MIHTLRFLQQFMNELNRGIAFGSSLAFNNKKIISRLIKKTYNRYNEYNAD